MALTERQKEIKGLLKQGKSADEIGTKLGISTNAVYQQIRRMRKSGENVGTRKATGTRKASTRGRKVGRQSSRKAPVLEPTAPPVDVPPPIAARPATPLQSVRNRRAEIHADIKLAESEVTAAAKALDTARAAHGKLNDRHAVELKALDAAEKALAPKPANTAGPKAASTTRKRASRAKSGPKAPATSPAASEPQSAPQNGQGDAGQVPTPETATA